MDENNDDKQPAPVEAAADPVLREQRQHRPRRRFPRRRYRDRGGRFGEENSNEAQNSSGGGGPASGDTGGATLGRQSVATVEGAVENGEQVQREPEFGEGIIEISGK